MTAPGDPDPVRSPPEFVPPRSPWKGRLAFAGLGFGLAMTSLVGTHYAPRVIPYGAGGAWLERLAMALPWIVGVAIVVQRIRRGRSWRWLSYAAGALALPVVALVFVVALFAVRYRATPERFDPFVWKAEAGSPQRRPWMVDDLLAQHPFVGSPVAEADALLGPDDEGSGASPSPDDRRRTWSLGNASLTVETDERGIVRDARVRDD